ncbi:MAG: cytochrome b [Pseudomonadota bacterium]
MERDSKEALSKATIWLHWIVGVAVIGMLSVGVYMDATHTYALYPWHKSFGFVLFFLILARVIWRMAAGWPPPVREYPTAERLLASVVHYLLLIGIVLMPISGFLMSAVGGSGVEVFGLEVVARNPDPNDPSETVAHNETVASIAHQMHGLVGYTLIVAVVLHTVGALKHHWVDKDRTMARMLGK